MKTDVKTIEDWVELKESATSIKIFEKVGDLRNAGAAIVNHYEKTDSSYQIN